MRTLHRHRATILVSVFLLTAGASAQSLQDNLWVTNGPVETIERSGNTVYIGGSFNLVGPSTGFGAAIDLTTGQFDPGMPKFNGFVYAVEADGSGGWFVGGLFSSVGGIARRNIVHILSDKTVDPAWAPNADSTVYALTMSGSTLYVGGMFANIGGLKRQRIAALSTTNGSPTPWDPGADAPVLALVVVDTLVYAGGQFTIIGGIQNQYFASIDINTGNAIPVDLSFDGQVSSMAFADIVGAGKSLFVGGAFTSINSVSHPRLAQINIPGGFLSQWTPVADAYVRDVKFDGTLVYVGGDFLTISQATHPYLAAIDLAGNVANWNPIVNSIVTRIGIAGSTVYIGGAFTSVAGQKRIGLAAIDNTGKPTSWAPDVNYPVLAFALSGNTMYAGGFFTSVNNITRNHLAAFDATTGKPTSWDPGPNNTVRDILALGSTIYVCGDFDSLGGQMRSLVGAIDASSGNVTSWDPQFAGGQLFSLATYGSNLLCGGNFEAVGQFPWNNLAPINLSTGLLDTSWHSEPNGPVTTIAIDGQQVYIGGLFSGIYLASRGTNVTRMYLADIDLGTREPTSWDPVADNWVRALIPSNGIVYAGGSFTTIGTQPYPHLAAIDASSGAPAGLNLDISGTFTQQTSVAALALAGNTLFVGGDFTNVLSLQRRGMFSVDVSSGNVTAFNPNTDQAVGALLINGTTVYVGGSFFIIGGEVRTGFAGIIDPSLTPSITVLSPNGGELWGANANQTIKWNSSNVSGNVHIELSRNNGSSFSDIIPSTPNSGSYNWLVTAPATQQAIVRVTSVDNPAISDNSDAPFTIGSPAIVLPDSVLFGSVIVGNVGYDSIVVANTGTDTLRLLSITSDNPAFNVSPGSGSVVPGGTLTIGVSFSPTQAGPYYGGIVITHNVGVGRDTVGASGSGITAGQLSLTPQSLQFSRIFVGDRPTLNVQATNTGTQPLLIDSLRIRGSNEFLVQGSTGPFNPLGGQQTLNIAVAFAPVSEGTKSGALIFYSDSPTSPDSVQLFGTALLPPIQPVLAGDTVAGSALGLKVTLPQGFVVNADTLFYRNGGERQYRLGTFSQTLDTLTAVFPDSVMNIRGVEYYVKLVSAAGNPVTFPVSNPSTSPSIVRVRVNSYPSPKMTLDGRYTMVSVPLELDNRAPDALLADDFGDYTKSIWRLFRWDGVENVEFPAVPGFAQGNAFWLITHASRSFDTGGGLSTNSSAPYTVNLQPGWNQIGNPFAFPVSWDSINTSNIVGPYSFDGTEFHSGVTVLMPWEGYFVRNDLAVPTVLAIPNVAAVVPKTPPAQSDAFRIQVSAEVSGTPYRDTQNYLGFDRSSPNYPDPPAIDDHLDVSLLEGGLPYMTSFRSPGAPGERWDLAIRSSIPGTTVRLQLGESRELPDGVGVTIVDGDNNWVIPLSNNSFSVSFAQQQTVRNIAVLVGSDDYLKGALRGVSAEPKRYQLLQNYPNPFNPTTTIAYELERRGSVDLGIYNILGQRVRTLVAGEEEAGRYSVTWDGRSDAGTEVSTGLYVYVLRAGQFIESRKMVLMR